ncbi:hypothetical protein OQA88_10075 [Cercophora sp. LCS_1]
MDELGEEDGSQQVSAAAEQMQESTRKQMGRPKRQPVLSAKPSKVRELAPRVAPHAPQQAPNMGTGQEIFDENRVRTFPLSIRGEASVTAQCTAQSLSFTESVSPPTMRGIAEHYDYDTTVYTTAVSTKFGQGGYAPDHPEGTWWYLGYSHPSQIYYPPMSGIDYRPGSFPVTQPVQHFSQAATVKPKKFDRKRTIEMTVWTTPDAGGNSNACIFDDVLVNENSPYSVMRHDVAEGLQLTIRELPDPRNVYTEKGRVTHRHCALILYQFGTLLGPGVEALPPSGAWVLVSPKNQSRDSPRLTIGREWTERNVYHTHDLLEWDQTYVAEPDQDDSENIPWLQLADLKWRHLFFYES